MKIGKGAKQDLENKLRSGLVQRRSNQQAEQNRAEQSLNAPQTRVQLGVARAIQEQLSAEKLLEEREEKLARIKEAVRNGTYNPPTEKVAQALGREIVLEILHGGPQIEDE